MATNSKFTADIGLKTDADLQIGGNTTIDGNATVSGNLTVNGTSLTVNATTTSVEDNMLELANQNTSSDTLDIGIYGNYDDGLSDGGATEYTGLFRDASDSTWKLFDGLEVAPTTTVNTSGAGYTLADLTVGDLTATTLTATNGLTGSSITYPTSDGTNGQVIKTNGSGDLSFGNASLDSLSDCTISAATPNSTTNPPYAGAMWIEEDTGDVYVCTNATTDNNTWVKTGSADGITASGSNTIIQSPDDTNVIHVNNSANVGIGTSNANHKVNIHTNDDDDYALRIEGSTNNSAVWTGIGLAGEEANTKAAIIFKDIGQSYSRGDLIFAVNNDADQTNASPSDARMVIKHDGDVIIGGSSPLGAGKLSIDSSGACIIGADTDAASGGYIQWLAGGTAKALLGFGSNSGAASINNVALRSQSGDLEFHTNGANERMRITSTGYVGISTTSPDTFLDVEGTRTVGGSGAGAIFNSTITPTNNNTASIVAIKGTINNPPSLNANSKISALRVKPTFPSSMNGAAHTAGIKIDSFDGKSATIGAGIYAEATTGADTNYAGYFSGNINVTGSVSKGSGSFRIDHPLESKTNTHHLIHSFVESPQADNIYRGKVDLVDGSATVNIDTVAGMTEGTFVALNREVQCFTTNESNWDDVKGSVSGNILNIESQNSESTATISWLVIGERQDQHMYDTEWTDDDGKVIVEPLKSE